MPGKTTPMRKKAATPSSAMDSAAAFQTETKERKAVDDNTTRTRRLG
jgi:hypothetical protein